MHIYYCMSYAFLVDEEKKDSGSAALPCAVAPSMICGG